MKVVQSLLERKMLLSGPRSMWPKENVSLRHPTVKYFIQLFCELT